MFPLVRYFSMVSAVTIGIAMIAVTMVLTKVTTDQLIEHREAANIALTQAFSNSVWPMFRRHVDGRYQTDGAGMDDLKHMSGYMKGVVARFLLEKMIKQGHLEGGPGDDQPIEVVIPVTQWQLQLLAQFSEDAKS